MRALFDVNVLLAMFDSGHTLHVKAQAWWAGNQSSGWASSPLTENGYLRVVSQASYPRPAKLSTALDLLRHWSGHPSHVFWADDLSLLDHRIVDYGWLLGPKQITDVYLLALAVKRGGRLVTLDRGIPLRAVKGASQKHLAVIA